MDKKPVGRPKGRLSGKYSLNGQPVHVWEWRKYASEDEKKGIENPNKDIDLVLKEVLRQNNRRVKIMLLKGLFLELKMPNGGANVSCQ
jgi:hypothetical protein